MIEGIKMQIVVKTDKIVDSLGTRYQLRINKIFDTSIDSQLITTDTDADRFHELAYNVFNECIKAYGIDNVFARSNE
jgi:hypothetical protein